jgi:hypothetical protein
MRADDGSVGKYAIDCGKHDNPKTFIFVTKLKQTMPQIITLKLYTYTCTSLTINTFQSSSARPASNSLDTEAVSPEIKRPGRKADHVFLPSTRADTSPLTFTSSWYGAELSTGKFDRFF